MPRQPPTVSDVDLCSLVWEIRSEHGACSVGQIAAAAGMSKAAVHDRLGTLQRRGLIRWSPGVHGSIRTTDEHLERR